MNKPHCRTFRELGVTDVSGRAMAEFTLSFPKPFSGKCVKEGAASRKLTFIVGAYAPGTMSHFMH